MSLGLGELTAQARRLIAAGDFASARALLTPALATVDPYLGRAAGELGGSGPGGATVEPAGDAGIELAEAAGLYARVLLALGQPDTARPWAALAYTITRQRYGSGDERVVTAAALLAAVLHRVGNHARAARLYERVVTELTAIDGPQSLRVLAAEADLAMVEHALGRCDAAIERLGGAWRLHREIYGEGHPAAIKMLTRLAAMERDCGLAVPSAEHFEEADRLCRTHLPAGHPLAEQVVALAAARSASAHRCRRTRPATSTDRTGTTPPEWPLVADRQPDAFSAGCRTTTMPAQSTRDDRRPLGSEVPSAGDNGAADNARADNWAAGITRRLIQPVPVAEVGPPPPRAAMQRGEWPGVRRVANRQPPPPVRPEEPVPRDWPEEPSLVQIPSPAMSPPRRPGPWRAAIVTLLAALAVGAGIALVLDAGKRRLSDTGDVATSPPATTPGSVAPTTSRSPGPPTGLTLLDGRDSVTLTWTYPPAAAGPVIVSGGRDGQQPRALEELPAGADGFVVHGLNSDVDYCFSVAVVYATDQISGTEAVCTARTNRRR